MSTWISTMFHQGGSSMFTILYLGVPAVLFALLHAVRPRRWSWWTAASITALVLGVGLLGWYEARSNADEFLERDARDPEPVIKPHERELYREQAYLEASRPLQFAGLVASICVLPLLIGEIRRRRASRSAS